MVNQKKINPENVLAVTDLKAKVEKNPNFILVAYSGMTVEGITNLRKKVKATGAEVKVIRNNLFLRALKESSKHAGKTIEFGPEYKGPMAAILSDELPSTAKICKDYAKENDKFVIKLGYFDGSVLDKKGVEAIAGLPTREELLSIIARGINTPATKIAYGMNEVIASVARAIKAVAEKNEK